jgi:hypothetical protein
MALKHHERRITGSRKKTPRRDFAFERSSLT